MNPARIQLSRVKGFNLQAHSMALNGLKAVNVARPAPWSNPFRIVPSPQHLYFNVWHSAIHVQRVRTREQAHKLAVGLFRDWLTLPWREELKALARRDLVGKNLACWCSPADLCHADVWLEYLADEKGL